MTRQSTFLRSITMFCSVTFAIAVFISCAGDNKAKTTETPKSDTVKVMDTADTRPIKPGSK